MGCGHGSGHETGGAGGGGGFRKNRLGYHAIQLVSRACVLCMACVLGMFSTYTHCLQQCALWGGGQPVFEFGQASFALFGLLFAGLCCLPCLGGCFFNVSIAWSKVSKTSEANPVDPMLCLSTALLARPCVAVKCSAPCFRNSQWPWKLYSYLKNVCVTTALGSTMPTGSAIQYSFLQERAYDGTFGLYDTKRLPANYLRHQHRKFWTLHLIS